MKKTSIAVIILFISLTSAKLFSQIAQLEKYDSPKSSGYHSLTSFYKINEFTPIELEYVSKFYPKYDILKSYDLSVQLNGIDSNVSNNAEKKINPNRKSPWIGAGLSFLIPGAGEFYAKSYVKSAIFFGIEVICWSAYAYYTHKGNTTTDDYQNFADANWDMRRYGNWLKNQQFQGAENINPDEPNLDILRNEINYCEEQNFSHTLPDRNTNSQQYYELIGKYQNFEAGWVGADQVMTKQNYETIRLPIFENYANERQQANNYYNDATAGIMVAIANHLLSAADAAWSVTIFNKKLDVQTGMEIKTYITPYTYQTKTLPSMKLKVNF
jgi:hypothetical protein